jgi:hypothetical protein
MIGAFTRPLYFVKKMTEWKVCHDQDGIARLMAPVYGYPGELRMYFQAPEVHA